MSLTRLFFWQFPNFDLHIWKMVRSLYGFILNYFTYIWSFLDEIFWREFELVELKMEYRWKSNTWKSNQGSDESQVIEEQFLGHP